MKHTKHRVNRHNVRCMIPVEIALISFNTAAANRDGPSDTWEGLGGVFEKFGGIQGMANTMNQLRNLVDSVRPFAPYFQYFWKKLNAWNEAAKTQRSVGFTGDEAVPEDEWVSEAELLSPPPRVRSSKTRGKSDASKPAKNRRRPHAPHKRRGKKQRPPSTDWDPLLIAFRS